MLYPINPLMTSGMGSMAGAFGASPLMMGGMPGMSPFGMDQFSPGGGMMMNPMAIMFEMLELGMMLGLMMGNSGGMMGGGMGMGFPGMGMGFPGMGMGFPGMGMGFPNLGMGLPGLGMPGMGYGFPGGGGYRGGMPYSPYMGAPALPAFPAFGGNRASQAVSVAASQVGVTGGNPRVREFSQGRSEAWCADFVSWSYEHTRGGSPFGHRAGVGSIRGWGEQNGLYHQRGTYQPRPGDILIYGDNQHTGLVERVDPNGTVHTIEGNTGGYGMRGGESAYEGAVARHTYSGNSGYITGYVDMQRYQ